MQAATTFPGRLGHVEPAAQENGTTRAAPAHGGTDDNRRSRLSSTIRGAVWIRTGTRQAGEVHQVRIHGSVRPYEVCGSRYAVAVPEQLIIHWMPKRSTNEPK
jgi:hypothetical protein